MEAAFDDKLASYWVNAGSGVDNRVSHAAHPFVVVLIQASQEHLVNVAVCMLGIDQAASSWSV